MDLNQYIFNFLVLHAKYKQFNIYKQINTISIKSRIVGDVFQATRFKHVIMFNGLSILEMFNKHILYKQTKAIYGIVLMDRDWE